MSQADALTQKIHRLWQGKGLISTLLLPLSWLTGLFIVLKRLKFRRQNRLAPQYPPVIVVGNIMVGGTGKTPVVIALAHALQQRGFKPGIISRGYGAVIGKAPLVSREALPASQIGDEPALIARLTGLPIAVHPRRFLALRTLYKRYPEIDVVISDDGLQHLALPRNAEVVVQDHRGVGNGRLLPAGPLREPVSRLCKVDVLIHNLSAGTAARRQVLPAGVLQVNMRLTAASTRHLASGAPCSWNTWCVQYGSKRIAAVAAIGQPDRFFKMLEADGVLLVQQLALPDHDSYENPPFASIDADIILITEKDAIKCEHINDTRIWVVEALTRFSDDGAWISCLIQRLKLAPNSPPY